MKLLLTTFNARFAHTSLALAYLAAAARGIPNVEVEVAEFTINSHLDDLLGEIFLKKAALVAFSCYIWNIDLTLKIAANLKKVASETIIVVGGPEVSYRAEELLAQHRYLDFVVAGEGEIAFAQLLQVLVRHEAKPAAAIPPAQLAQIGGLSWRRGEEIFHGESGGLRPAPEQLPSPYLQGDLTRFREQIAYLESSRGCPYSCSYCLSAATKGVSYFPLSRIETELGNLMAAGAKQVKFVDRTFNAKKEHAMALWQFLLAENRRRGGLKTNFHFEINGELLDQEMLAFLRQIPAGLFQFEIGVQSTNPETLKAINRPVDFAKLAANVHSLRRFNNIHLHLDLIAGLPYENLDSFIRSFNQVLSLRPHHLQLGFLKMLPGAPVRKEAEKYGYLYTNQPPYEVLANKFLAYEELLLLKKIAHLVEKLYNSQQFFYTMDYLLRKVADGFGFFRQLLAAWQDAEKAQGRAIKQKEFYPLLADFCRQILPGEQAELARELLKVDLLRQQRLTQLPGWTKSEPAAGLAAQAYRFFTDPQVLQEFFPSRAQLGYAKLAKQLHFEPVSGQAVRAIAEAAGKNWDLPGELAGRLVLLFDYGGEAEPVLGGARLFPVVLDG